VIVGASVAGVGVARGLRSEGYDGGIVLVGGEPDWPYDKPPLSKQVLCGDWAATRTSLLTPAQAAELALDIRLGLRAEHLDVAGREVVLQDASRIGYDACVVATGSSPRPSPWPERPGVHVLRTLHDALEIRGRLLDGGRLAVVGGGFIGAEVASSARDLGLEATIIDPLALPMERIVGMESARLFVELAERNGIELRLGHGVEGIEGTAGDLNVWLTDGTSVHAATAVVGIGVVPNDTWLVASGLLVDNGVVCDAFCRAEGAAGVFAAGDVARWHHPGREAPVRLEHWTNAVDQAACVAHNLAHPDDLRPYAPIPYVWTDQHGWRFQIVGQPAGACRHEIVGDLAVERPRAAVVYADAAGRLVGALSINWPRALADCRRTMTARGDADAVIRRLTEQLVTPARS
jgi:NADPH-dependent 2,4-dienoyl-CoA reductase/sulfur reductase-like enzyme